MTQGDFNLNSQTLSFPRSTNLKVSNTLHSMTNGSDRKRYYYWSDSFESSLWRILSTDAKYRPPLHCSLINNTTGKHYRKALIWHYTKSNCIYLMAISQIFRFRPLVLAFKTISVLSENFLIWSKLPEKINTTNVV